MEGQGLATIALWNSVCRTSGALLQQVKLGGAHIVAEVRKWKVRALRSRAVPEREKRWSPAHNGGL